MSALLLRTLVLAASPGFWTQASPQGPEEAALRDALRNTSPIESLRGVSAAHPGSAASGLAQLAAGLVLLDSGRPAEALPFLSHPDLARTAVPDHALVAFGRALQDREPEKAAQSYLAAAVAPSLVCPALFGAAEAFVKASRTGQAVEVLDRALGDCPDQAPRALLTLGVAHEKAGNRRAAALAYDRLDSGYPASAQAPEAAARLRALRAVAPARTPERQFEKGSALLSAGRYRDAVAVLRLVPASQLPAETADRLRLQLGRALLALGRAREAEASLRAVAAGSPHAPEAAYHLARAWVRRGRSVDAYEAVAREFPATAAAEDALLALAAHYQKDNLDGQALPYYRRLLAEHPAGRYVERSAWRVAWADYRAGRFEEAAGALETTARVQPPTSFTPGFLYWAGRARAALGQSDRARQLLEEAVQRFKRTYHGLRAQEALARLPGAQSPSPLLLVAGAAERLEELPEPVRTRAHQLLLLDRLDEAAEELRTLPFSPKVQATLAWIDWRQGRLRPAILSMKKAYPEYAGEAGDRLPEEVWRILYPLQFEEMVKAKAAEEGLDPALVAAIICQESAFEPGAISRAGARGLMQVIPATGRKLARELGVRYRHTVLYDPVTSLDFGTRYLRQMMDRYQGRLERVLAAYNAGPHRVDAWTAERPDVAAEEFIESIPFTETRGYVMTVLAAREQYRRLYGLERPAGASTGGGTEP